MPSCEKVHEWIEGHGFTSEAEAKRYVKKDFPRRSDNENLYECIESYDFDYRFAIYTNRGHLRLYRIERGTNRFAKLDLDPQAKAEIFDFLRMEGF